ncbi:MAG: Bug family tripartite tricarboxylate transporter substrate binding protein [Lautropia sp.]
MAPMTRRQFTMAAALLAAAPAARSQAPADWPNRAIRMLVPFPVGGNSDNLARILAERMSADLGVTIVVDNRAGGTTQIGTELAANAAPDGYTILLGAGISFTVLPNLRRKLPYDLRASFEPLGAIAKYVAVAAVRKSLGVNTLEEFVALAQRSPGKLMFGSAGLSSFGHIAGEIIKRDARVDLLHVPYKGSADASQALAAGQVDLVIDGTTVPLVKSGLATALFTFDDRRHPELPAVPAIHETSFPLKGPTGPAWGLFAPHATPKPIVERLVQSLQKVMAEPDTQARLLRISCSPDWRSPAGLLQAFDEDRRFYAELLPAIGLKPD